MNIETKYHGKVEYEEEEVITFPKGMLGFEDLKKFIICTAEENPLFKILHSIEDNAISFVVISPFEVMEHYEVRLSKDTINELNIEKEEDVILLNTVTLNSKVENITTNLKAPIVINIKEKLGEQIIIDNDKYKIKYPLIKE